MFCKDCGAKLALKYCYNEGLVPYCNTCAEFKFPPFSTAVSMLVVNREGDKVLLARHVEQDDFILFAGYIKKQDNVERTLARELKEETGLRLVKSKYIASRYHEPRNVLMLGFVVMVEDDELNLNEDEISEVKWCTFEEAQSIIRKNSIAEAFLQQGIQMIKKGI